ncbi:urea transporter [Sphingobacterium psychroaquaticum]|uniref:Urea transporter n=1 Tax=Sphingobacterium psychroaquaticum TaxID=561061 RepID=A0A1X7KCT9_9SPHI|nr:urea transporter [Sphingobacterium psychroaquaticum]QBQ42897.1 urea transporter [Sphingobacterium psychroaquaticum]SMG39026.1 urea transporter [Sphingobacterium psychroaquaticum]
MKNKVLAFTKAFFRGFGQIMLQGNAWTGLLFIGAIFYDSPLMGLAAVLSNLTGIATAYLMRCKQEDINNGLFGFNASLFGIALVFYFEENTWVWVTIILGSVLSAMLMAVALQKKFPVYTFPFIAVTWISLYVLSIPELAMRTVPEHFVDIKQMDDFLIEGHAFGQVIFQGSVTAGFIFFLGVFISEPIAALYGFAAVIVSIYLSHYGNESQSLINNGTFSFNAVLCGIAMSGQRIRDGLYVLVTVVIATYVDRFMLHGGWTTLTFPFVVAMWMLGPIKWVDRWVVNKWNILRGEQI